MARKSVTVESESGLFIIRFPYNHKTVDKVRQLEKRRFHLGSKHWTAPITEDNIKKLIAAGFKVPKKAKQNLVIVHAHGGIEKIKQPARQKSKINFKSLNIPSLRKYQRNGIRKIDQYMGRSVLADEMGLGKTIQALAWLKAQKGKAYPALIVCPSVQKFVWMREAIEKEKANMSDCSIIIADGRTPDTLTMRADIIIINYDIVSHWVPKIPQPKTVILDEAHFIKNHKAQRTKAIQYITKKAKHIIGISGTPIVNKPIEFFTMLNIIDKNLFPSRWEFAKRYCGLKHNGFGWYMNGATNMKELHDKLMSTIMIRRTKAKVLKELPKKQRVMVPLPVDHKKYIESIKELTEDVGVGGAAAMIEIEKMKQAAFISKQKLIVEWVTDYIEDSGKKIVLFTTHHNALDYLKDALSKFGVVTLDGRTSKKNKIKAIDYFQGNENIKIFIGNLDAAGISITLTAADSVAFCEFGWTPGDHVQAEDRVHRFGQKSDSVTAYYLMAMGTIDEKIARLIDRKARILNAVLDGKDAEDGSMLSELLNELRGTER